MSSTDRKAGHGRKRRRYAKPQIRAVHLRTRDDQLARVDQTNSCSAHLHNNNSAVLRFCCGFT